MTPDQQKNMRSQLADYSKGELVDLAALVRDRGALLVFYRGGW